MHRARHGIAAVENLGNHNEKLVRLGNKIFQRPDHVAEWLSRSGIGLGKSRLIAGRRRSATTNNDVGGRRRLDAGEAWDLDVRDTI